MDAIKFFGRWLSNAVELYLLQCPMKHAGGCVASAMAGLVSVFSGGITGSDPDEKTWDAAFPDQGRFHAPKMFQRATVKVGSQLNLLLPDMLTSVNVDEIRQQFAFDDEVFEFEEAGSFLECTVVALLPVRDPTELAKLNTLSLQAHESATACSTNVLKELGSLPSDAKCCVVSFGSGKDKRFLVVSLRTVSFTVTSV